VSCLRRKRIRRKLRLGLAGLAFAALVVPATAAAGVRVSGIDLSHYPTTRATVYSTAGPRSKPVLTEGGIPVAEFRAVNLAHAKSVVLAIDQSRSMAGRSFADAVAAARSFVAAKPASDRISVIAFGSVVRALSRFSTDPGDADVTLAGLAIDAHQGTALYDAVWAGARQLSAQDGGRVLILLTDGTDTTSKASLASVAKVARVRNVLVYPIAIAGPSYDPAPLEQLASETGGTFYRANSSSSLARVYHSIAAALRNTWRVEYLTAARPGERFSLQATVAGAGSASTFGQIPAEFGSQLEPPSKLVPKAAYGPSGPLALGILVGVLSLAALALVLAAYRGSWVRSRIAAHVGDTRGNVKDQRRQQRLAALGAIFRATEQAFGSFKQWRWVQRMLERANVPLRTVEFFWIMLGAAFGPAMLGALAGQKGIVILLLMGIGGAMPFLYVWMKMRRRLRAFEDQLPDILITIAASLKAGHSFKQGLQAVVDEGQPPASDEFKRVLTETSLGRPMDEALSDMAVRAGSKNFEFVITAVTIQRQVGGSLAALFDMVADLVRQRQQFARKIRSLTAMGRMSAYTLVGIPFFLAVVIELINPEYMAPLFHSHSGHLLMFLGVTMMLIGSAILRKIVSFRG
jgi:tight adherence protein B